MTTTPQQAAYAVMEDETVLCADCVPEICDASVPATSRQIHLQALHTAARTADVNGIHGSSPEGVRGSDAARRLRDV